MVRTTFLCRGSVVRMKSSFEMLSFGSSARNSALTSSTNCCGAMPLFLALACTFWPCSSTPVRKCT